MPIRILVVLLALAIVSTCVAVQAEEPIVFQLDATNLSTRELAQLSTDLAELEMLLRDTTLGPQRQLGQNSWTVRSFALFSAGSLADRGYPIYLAEDEERVWVLVGLVAAARTLWIPVEAAPSSGIVQTTLGRIPYAQASSSSLHVAERYLSFDSTFPLPRNLGPVARFRTSSAFASAGDVLDVSIGREFQLSASSSSDPDGSIALYRWCIGVNPCAATTRWSYSTRLDEYGTTPITLIVVDNAGRSASVSATLNVVDAPPPPDGGDGDCGCG